MHNQYRIKADIGPQVQDYVRPATSEEWVNQQIIEKLDPGPGKLAEPHETPGMEVMMIDVTTGNFRRNQERPGASQTMVHVNVFELCLKDVGRWDPRVVREETVEQMLTRAKSCVTAWRGMEFNCRGPFIMPIAVDGLWAYQLGVVTEDDRIMNQFVLCERILMSAFLRQAVDWYQVLLDDNAGACVKVSFLHEVVIARDTGASENIMMERLWEKIRKPALLEAPPNLFARTGPR